MEEGESFFFQYLELVCFIYMPIPKSITLVGRKKYIYLKVMGAHAQKGKVNPT